MSQPADIESSIRPLAAADSGAQVKAAGNLRSQLEHGTTEERLHALRELISWRLEGALVDALASSNPAVAQLAISGLWECWLDEAGTGARRALEAGIDSLNMGDLGLAAAQFEALIAAYPGWAEAINKLATVLYFQGRLEDSIKRCHEVVALKPDHFGAWNGMALCAVQVEDWGLAQRAVEESLRLQPCSTANEQLLALIRARLG